MKVLKVPVGLIKAPYYKNALTLNGLSVVESCTNTSTVTSLTGSMFLEEPVLQVVLEGTSVITVGRMQYTVRSGEMMLLKKATHMHYHKTGDPDKGNVYDSLLFFLKEELIIDFMKMVKIESTATAERAVTMVKPGRSLSSFKRDFYAIYQTTPATWIREKRLVKAREMLSTGMGVAEVCYSLGFESPAHFSRLFKSHFGQTPRAMKVV